MSACFFNESGKIALQVLMPCGKRYHSEKYPEVRAFNSLEEAKAFRDELVKILSLDF
jgi:hypothetical protein